MKTRIASSITAAALALLFLAGCSTTEPPHSESVHISSASSSGGSISEAPNRTVHISSASSTGGSLAE